LQQFHFHHPSEDQIKGKSYPLEAHLVHADPAGKLAVVAIFLEQGPSSPLMKTIFSHLPKIKGQEKSTDTAVNVGDLLPKTRSYVTYSGSLTTPPCTEGVSWIVMDTPVTLSDSEIATFENVYRFNARPVQSLNGRSILNPSGH
jgi:carbonic anhydrase